MRIMKLEKSTKKRAIVGATVGVVVPLATMTAIYPHLIFASTNSFFTFFGFVVGFIILLANKENFPKFKMLTGIYIFSIIVGTIFTVLPVFGEALLALGISGTAGLAVDNLIKNYTIVRRVEDVRDE